jgi:hypothetical protein
MKEKKTTAESRRRPELLATAWPLVLEAAFLGAFFACRELVDVDGDHMPEAVAIVFLTVIATDLLAAVFKVRAVRHRQNDGTLSPLPQLLIVVLLFSVLRLAVFGSAVIGAVISLAGGQPEYAYNLLIVAVAAKELLLLWILWPRRGASVPGRTPLVVEMIADLNLTVLGVFPALLLASLFA